MRYKIFKDDELINTIKAEQEFIEEYCAENGYAYEAEILPETEPETEETEFEPTAQDDTDAMLVDHEYRITLLELGLAGEV